jgi:hypothetical protein
MRKAGEIAEFVCIAAQSDLFLDIPGRIGSRFRRPRAQNLLA